VKTVPVSGKAILVSGHDLKDLKELLEKKKLKYSFLKIKAYSDYNSPINSILRFIDKLGIDLIVMGTTGASGIKEILLGSTTSSVISKVNIPTFVIPEYSNISQANEMIISADLLGLENQKPMKFAKKIASQLDLSVEVLNVYSEENSSIELQMDKKRERLQSVFENKKITFKLIKSDNVEESILNNVKENSILAVVSRSRGFFENLFHSSMSKRLTMHSKNPILVLHE
jgi:hypothetical protein